MFLDGKMFPSGFLSTEKFKAHVFDIANFISIENFLEELLQFDSESFFSVIAKLFYDSPYKFLITQKGKAKSPEVIIDLFFSKCKGNQVRIKHFNKLVVQVQSKFEKIEYGLKPIDIDYEIVKQAVYGIVKVPTEDFDEFELISALKAKNFKKEDI